MPQAARVDYWPGKSRSERPLISTPWRRQDKCPGAWLLIGTGVNQTTCNINKTVTLEPMGFPVTGANQGTQYSCDAFGDALGNLLKSACPGTGGEPHLAEATMQSILSASGAYFVVQPSPQPISQTSREEGKLTEAGKELALIRHYFSLSTTDLSKI